MFLFKDFCIFSLGQIFFMCFSKYFLLYKKFLVAMWGSVACYQRPIYEYFKISALWAWTFQYSGDAGSNAGQENDDLDQVDAAEADAMGMMDTGDLDAEMAAADMAGNDF